MLLKSASHRTHYDLVGPDSGDVVCLGHALLADGGMWADQVPPLVSAGYRVLRIDLRGHGGSDAPAGPCSVDDLANDVLAVLDQLSLERVHYVGLSIGAVIGQALAICYPDRLLSLVLSDTNRASAPGAKTMWEERIAVVEKTNSTAPLGPAMMDRLLTAEFKERRPARWKEVLATIEGTRPEGMYACAQALQNFDFESQLPSIGVRTLVLCGANDPATPPSEAKKIAGLIPNAQYIEISNALHFPNIEQASIYSQILLSWLDTKAGAFVPAS